jgi:CelD/BcsL family acetyltransferase involved in cellulose biosynthesis
VLTAARRAATLFVIRREQAAAYANLAAIRRSGSEVLGACSANTRQQVRRSDRLFQQHGLIRVRREDTPKGAQERLDHLAALHQAAWQARGQTGCFAQPFFTRFHRALITEGLPRGEIALLHVSAGAVTIGVLYNFVWRGRMLAYQSGFDYPPCEKRAKPGLTCHHAAMRYALDAGLDTYDFLAGDDRYKRSLSGAARPMAWASCGPAFRVDLAAEWVRQQLCQVAGIDLSPEPIRPVSIPASMAAMVRAARAATHPPLPAAAGPPPPPAAAD